MANHDSSPKKKAADRPHDGAATAKRKKKSGPRALPPRAAAPARRRSSEVAKTVIFGASAAMDALAGLKTAAPKDPKKAAQKAAQKAAKKTVVFGVGRTLNAPSQAKKAPAVMRTVLFGVARPESETPAPTTAFQSAQERALASRRRKRTSATGGVRASFAQRAVVPEDLGDDTTA